MRVHPIAAALLLLAGGWAQAEPVVKVAHVSVDLVRGEWMTLDRRERVVATVETMRGTISADEVALALVEQRRVRAVVMLSVTPSGRGRVEWQSGCSAGSEQIWSTELRGGHPVDLQCAEASGAYRAASFFTPWPAALASIQRQSLDLPAAFVLASAKVGTRSGLMMSVTVLADENFAGLPEGAPERLLPTVKAAHAAYALQLGTRIRDCLYSIRTNMELPPLNFAADAPAEQRVVANAH